MSVTSSYDTTTAAQSAATSTAATSGSSASATAITSDFQTFLKMMTTQLQNQDPLNPIDSSDYAVQLATFSGVEQQMKTNSLLESLGAQMGLIGMSELSGWVGSEVRAEVPVVFDGTPVTLSPNPASLADRAILVVRDSSGTLLAREDIPVSTEPYQWLGADAAGDPLPAGTYTLTLESWNGEELLTTTGIESYARIAEVQGTSSGTVLVLVGGTTIAASEVTALRKP